MGTQNLTKFKNLGTLSSFLMFGSIAIISLLRPNYNHFKKSFSELGLLNSPYFILFNFLTFITVGVMNYFYFNNLKKLFVTSEVRTRGLISLQIASICWILTGIFPLSRLITWLYIVHITFAFLSYIFSGSGVILVGADFINSDKYYIIGICSIVFGILIWVGMFALINVIGAVISQLVSILLFFIWLLMFSIYVEFHLKPNDL